MRPCRLAPSTTGSCHPSTDHSTAAIWMLPRAHILRATLRRHLSEFDLAAKDIREALQIAEHFSMPLFSVDACLEAAHIELVSGQRVGQRSARGHLEFASKLLDETRYERRRVELRDLTALLDAASTKASTERRPAVPMVETSGPSQGPLDALLKRVRSVFQR